VFSLLSREKARMRVITIKDLVVAALNLTLSPRRERNFYDTLQTGSGQSVPIIRPIALPA